MELFDRLTAGPLEQITAEFKAPLWRAERYRPISG